MAVDGESVSGAAGGADPGGVGGRCVDGDGFGSAGGGVVAELALGVVAPCVQGSMAVDGEGCMAAGGDGGDGCGQTGFDGSAGLGAAACAELALLIGAERVRNVVASVGVGADGEGVVGAGGDMQPCEGGGCAGRGLDLGRGTDGAARVSVAELAVVVVAPSVHAAVVGDGEGMAAAGLDLCVDQP